MRILAIETSTMMGSVAIIDENGLIAEYRLNIKATHSERLMKMIDEVLKDSGIKLNDIDCYAVSIGPGSFTGLRIGLSTVKGLAFVTNKPVAAIPTLDALACNIPFSIYQICPMLDARKKEVYTAIYSFTGKDEFSKLIEDTVIRPELLLRKIKEPTVFLGEGASIYRGLIKEALGHNAYFAPKAKQQPSAANVAELGLRAILNGNIEDLTTLTPKYIRKSEAEIKASLESGIGKVLWKKR